MYRLLGYYKLNSSVTPSRTRNTSTQETLPPMHPFLVPSSLSLKVTTILSFVAINFSIYSFIFLFIVSQPKYASLKTMGYFYLFFEFTKTKSHCIFSFMFNFLSLNIYFLRASHVVLGSCVVHSFLLRYGMPWYNGTMILYPFPCWWASGLFQFGLS